MTISASLIEQREIRLKSTYGEMEKNCQKKFNLRINMPITICVTVKRLVFHINNINFNEYHEPHILTTALDRVKSNAAPSEVNFQR